MKIWIDALTPKQVLYFNGIAEELEKLGNDIFFTIRKFRETMGLAEKYIKSRFEVAVVGEYGGGKLKDKLISSLRRSLELVDIVLEKEPDIAISFTSPDATRVSFGLGIPHIACSDTPHADAVSRLSLPLSKRLYTPWVIPKGRWTKYGIKRDRIFQYKGLDPLVWILRHRDDLDTIEKYELKDHMYIVVRPIEYKAAYQLNTDYNKMIGINKWIPNFIRETGGDIRVYILPRYKDHIVQLKKTFGEDNRNIVVIEEVVDGLTLLKYSTGFVGYGGTMTMEAALMGKPTLTLRPGRQPEYIKYLMKKGLVKRARSLKMIVEILKKGIDENYKSRADKIIKEMTDPAKYIAETIKSQPVER